MCGVSKICYVSDTEDVSLPKVDLPSESSRREGQEDRRKEHKEYQGKEPLPQAQAWWGDGGWQRDWHAFENILSCVMEGV